MPGKVDETQLGARLGSVCDKVAKLQGALSGQTTSAAYRAFSQRFEAYRDVDLYLRRYLFTKEEDGRWALHDDSSYGQNLIRCLAEVAEVFAYHPDKETFEKEIAEAIPDARKQNLQDALEFMSYDERVDVLEHRLHDLKRGMKVMSELEELDRRAAEAEKR